MEQDYLTDISDFLSELGRETDRGLPLVAAAFIDEKLKDSLQAFFCESYESNKLFSDGNAPLGSFSSRIELSYALGLIDDYEYHEIGLIRKVRNEFAHTKHGFSFADEKVKGYCSSFKADLPEGAGHPTKDARFRFINAVSTIIIGLYWRPHYAGKERREGKEWIPAEDRLWRSVKDNPLPKDKPFLATVAPRKQKKD